MSDYIAVNDNGNDSSHNVNCNRLEVIQDHGQEDYGEEYGDDGEETKLTMPKSPTSTVKVMAIGEAKRMQNMEVKSSGERKPTQVGHRRKIAISAFVLFFLSLGVILVVESINSKKHGIVVSKTRSATRRDVFVVRATSNGSPLLWKDPLLKDEKLVKLVVAELGKIPFPDFSVEIDISSLNNTFALACLKEETPHKIQSESRVCSAEQENEIKEVASMPVERCFLDTSSALKNAIKCGKGSDGVSTEKLLSFWKKALGNPVEGQVLSTRCCDYDGVFFDKVDSGLLRMCATSAEPSFNFLRYYGKENVKTCAESFCGCECRADEDQKTGMPCPVIPERYKSPSTCSMISMFTGSSPSCDKLPVLATKYKKLLASKGIDFGSNARCYGTYTTK
mmetsp:Transcript_6404/g.10092  ORF Transcript_6404/g.10092 Transcript_6404/m.10092 type:complete len:393 (+) Transcript_6404:180-1358(+)